MQVKKFFNAEFSVTDTGEFTGYASVFDGVDSYGDTIKPTTYDFILGEIAAGRESMPKMFYNHDSWKIPVGKWLELLTDKKGLLAKGKLNLKTQSGADIYESMKFGSIDGLSVCIEVPDYDIMAERRIIETVTKMPEISVVTYPADNKARIFDIKSALSSYNSLKDIERMLRDVAPEISKADACAIISAVKRIAKAETQRESVGSELAAIKEKILSITK